MKKLFNIVLFAIFATIMSGCYHGALNTPGYSGTHLTPSPPAKYLGDQVLADKSLDYDYLAFNRIMDHELIMKKAWEQCLVEFEDADICREIHGDSGFPFYMAQYYMPMYGMGFMYGGPAMGYGMGYTPYGYSPYGYGMQANDLASQAMAAQQTMMYLAMAKQQATMATTFSAYSLAAANAWSTPTSDPAYEQNLEILKQMRDETVAEKKKLLEIIDELQPMVESAAATAPEDIEG